MFSARLPVTYSRKRGRRKYVAETSTSLPSSPLRELSPSKHDVTLSEMSRRMKKRSRQVVGSQQLAEHDLDNRVAKKLKPPSELDLCSMAQRSPVPTVPSTPVHHSGLTLPLNTQQIYDSLFETPSRPSDEQLIKSYIEPDQLSPIPVARRMLSRTNSRNLKENIGSSRQCLASPFSSRPASRTSSPRQALKTNKGRPLHSKSRTLSSSFGRQQAKPVDTTQSATSHGHEDSIFDSIFSPTTHAPFTGISTHGRTGSIPSMPSNLLNHIPAQDWLVPAKALSRSPPSLEDMQLDDIATDHPSFYLDEPAQISTPPRKRRMTVTLRNFRPPAVENHQSDSVPMDLTDPVTAAEEDRIVTDTEEDGGPAHSRRRRRTVVHMSSDSIFSSALDFSAYMTEFSPTQKIHNGPQPPLPQVPPGLTAPCSDFLDPTLDSACAPTPLDPAFSPASNIALALDLAIVSGPNSPTVPGPVSHTIPPTPEVSRPCLSRRAKSLQNPTPSGKEELHKMFVTLGLYGGPEEAPVEADDSGVGLEKTVAELPISSNGRAEAQTHRRKRGDTIRASDFARPVASFESASATVPSTARADAEGVLAAPQTRRTRSGTVTLAKPAPAARARAGKRAGKLATIPMKVDDNPLTPQGSDEEDDELLLRRGVFWTEE